MNISEVLEQHSFRIKELLRRYNIIGPVNMQSIEKGFKSGGETFMLKLLEIITPDESSFSQLITPKSGIIATTPIDTKTLATSSATTTTTTTTGKAWSFWENLLSAVGKTGEALAEFKKDVAGSTTEPEYTPQQLATQQNNKTLLYMAAGGLLLLIIIFLILRK